MDDVTFARLVAEGKVSLVTLKAVGRAVTWLAGDEVTPGNASAGLKRRVVRGPDWIHDVHDEHAGKVGVLNSTTRYTTTSLAHKVCVRWESSSLDFEYNVPGCSGRDLYFAVAGAPAFAFADVTTPPVVKVEFVGGSKDSFVLNGNAEERVTKMLVWLPQNGLALSGSKELGSTWVTRITKILVWLRLNGLALRFCRAAQSGGKPDVSSSTGNWVRTWTFTRADLPF